MEHLGTDSDSFETPPELFHDLDDEFGPFDVDVACTPDNCKGKHRLGIYEDSLETSWHRYGKRAFCNPPYTRLIHWVRKAHKESRKGCLVVMLLPADVSTGWYRYCCKFADEVRNICGRIRFVGGATSARFGSCIVVFRPQRSYTFTRAR